jgi:hypothetical protein
VSTPSSITPYPIGIPGTPWGTAEKNAWLACEHVKRSYAAEVVAPLKDRLCAQAELLQYGVLDYTPLGLGTYPLFAVRSRAWDADRPVAVITGGVHGYETSGVQGALQWLEREFHCQTGAVNVLVLPCISPWAYETINRWNPYTLDPNRQFKQGSPAAESALAMACVAAQGGASTCMSICTKPPTPTTANSAPPGLRVTARPSNGTPSPTAFIWWPTASDPSLRSSVR